MYTVKLCFVSVTAASLLALCCAYVPAAFEIGCTGCKPGNCRSFPYRNFVRCLECSEGYTLTLALDRISQVCLKGEEYGPHPSTEPYKVKANDPLPVEEPGTEGGDGDEDLIEVAPTDEDSAEATSLEPAEELAEEDMNESFLDPEPIEGLVST